LEEKGYSWTEGELAGAGVKSRA